MKVEVSKKACSEIFFNNIILFLEILVTPL